MKHTSKTQNLCMFCGEKADTREHVIPQWMHHHFDIKHEKLRLRNDTQIKYIHEVVPACNECNGIRYSKIEQRVKNQNASAQDYYVWGLKIHCGLNLKDTFLPENIREPHSGTVLTIREAFKGIEFSNKILAGYQKQSFTLYPHPFGSVFLTDLPDNVTPDFSLCSVGYPHHVLTISITNDRLLTVILNDKGLTKKAIKSKQLIPPKSVDWLIDMAIPEANMNANTYAKFITLHYTRQRHRISVPSGYVSNSRRVAALRIPKKVKIKKDGEDNRLFADIVGKLFEWPTGNM